MALGQGGAARVKQPAPSVHCRILKAAGRWRVPRDKRPKLAPPPRELTAVERVVDRWISPLEGLHKA